MGRRVALVVIVGMMKLNQFNGVHWKLLGGILIMLECPAWSDVNYSTATGCNSTVFPLGGL